MWRILGRSLILRLVGVSLLLLLIVQLAGFAVVRAGIERNARSQIARQLDVDENVWLRLLEQNAERLRQGSALLAADYGFRSAVHSGDEETIQSVLENHGERIGAAATALLDTNMAYRALTAPSSAQAFIPTLGPVHITSDVRKSKPLRRRSRTQHRACHSWVEITSEAPRPTAWPTSGKLARALVCKTARIFRSKESISKIYH